jgi:hypothetical protein
MVGENFILGDDGGVYYVDVLKMDHTRIETWDVDAISEYMYGIGHDFGPVQAVLGHIQSLINLPGLRYDYR